MTDSEIAAIRARCETSLDLVAESVMSRVSVPAVWRLKIRELVIEAVALARADIPALLRAVEERDAAMKAVEEVLAETTKVLGNVRLAIGTRRETQPIAPLLHRIDDLGRALAKARKA